MTSPQHTMLKALIAGQAFLNTTDEVQFRNHTKVIMRQAVAAIEKDLGVLLKECYLADENTMATLQDMFEATMDNIMSMTIEQLISLYAATEAIKTNQFEIK